LTSISLALEYVLKLKYLLGIQHIILFMLRKLVYFPTKKVHYKSFLTFQQKIRKVRFKRWAKLLVAPSFKLKGVYRRLPQV